MSKFDKDRKVIEAKSIGHYNEKKYKEAMKVIARLEKEVEAVKKLAHPLRKHIIVPTKGINQSEAVSLVVLSDMHVDEVVNPNAVQGRNKYNPEIARQRMDKFFELTVRLTEKERQDVHIDTLVVALLGDSISNNIHDELLANTAMRPMEAIRHAQCLISNGLTFLENCGKFKKIVVICKDGN